MTVITYVFSEGAGEIVDFSAGGERTAFKLGSGQNGTLLIGKISVPVVSGRCEVSLGRLPDGAYAPLFIGKSESIELEAIRKFGREILPLPISEKIQRRLLSRVSSLEKRLSDAEEQITALKDKISRGTTF